MLDGKRMFVSVGSQSNVAEGIGKKSPDRIRAWESGHGLGATWGFEERRADVLVFDPEGKGGRTFATGLRNCVGMAVHPATGDLGARPTSATAWARTSSPTTSPG